MMRAFPTDLVMTLCTEGICFRNRPKGYQELHVAFDYLLGYPIMLHHLTLRRLWQAVARDVRFQHPALAEQLAPGRKYRLEEAERMAEAAVAIFGPELLLHPMAEPPDAPSLFEGLEHAREKTVVVVGESDAP